MRDYITIFNLNQIVALKLLHVQFSLVLVAEYKQLHVERRYTIHLCSYIEFALVSFGAITGTNSLLFSSFSHPNKKIKWDRKVTWWHVLRTNFYFPGNSLFQVGCTSVYPKHTSSHPLCNTDIRMHTHVQMHTYTLTCQKKYGLSKNIY